MDNQQAMNKMIAHLSTAPGRAIVCVFDVEECAYLTPEGNKCVVGCLLLHPELAPRALIGDWTDENLSKQGLCSLNLVMLGRMQSAHDQPFSWDNSGEFSNWERIKQICDDFGLEYTGPDID